MKILVDINHPADVHFFRYAIAELRGAGHEIVVTSRDKDVAVDLLDAYGIPHRVLSKARAGLANLGMELLTRNLRMIGIFRRERIGLALAVTGTSIAQVGKLLGVPSLVFYDNEEAGLQNRLTYPFATRIYTPSCYRDELGPKQHRYRGVKELAYLHPSRYRPDPAVLGLLGVSVDEPYVLVRTVAWAAAHDIGQAGLSWELLQGLIDTLRPHARVFVISEGALRPELESYRTPVPPEKIHDVLFHAALLIGEGATMACESACLGTPAIYVNSLMPSHVAELDRAGLVFHLSGATEIADKALEILLRTEPAHWHRLARAFVAANGDVTAWMVDEILAFAAHLPADAAPP